MAGLAALAEGDKKRVLLIGAGVLAALGLALSLAHSHPQAAAHTSIMAAQHRAPVAAPAPQPAAPVATGIAEHLAKGRRAFSLRVSPDEIVGGFLQSGDHVDVFATLPGALYPASHDVRLPDRSQTLLLLQNVPVLAVGEKLATKGAVQPAARTVSLSLTPEGLARLALAQRFGKISLAIRAPGDTTPTPPARATLADLAPGPGGTLQSDTPAKTGHAHTHAIPFYAGAHLSWRHVP